MRPPRVVVVTRPTQYELVIGRYGTEGQARFVLSGRGQDLDRLRAAHHAFLGVLHTVRSAIPLAWRQTHVPRHDLDRFLFAPDDVVVVVGQDGLVANAARFLEGQPVLGVDGAPGRNAGVLVRHDPIAAAERLQAGVGGFVLQPRVMVEVTLGDGQRLRGLNEIFVGHRTHQSARYRLDGPDGGEPQSSSGLIVSTGTGATGWAASIARQRATEIALPTPEEPRLAWFVREPWPGPGLGVTLDHGALDEAATLELTSHMDEGGVIFSDGIESDALGFERGQRATIAIAPQRLNLVV